MAKENAEGSGLGSSGDEVGDPFSELMTSAVNLHELYASLVAGGFSEYAAMWMVAAMMKGLPMPEWLCERLSVEEA